MNKIVREHYPVERLPNDLRQDLGMARTVKLVIESDDVTSRERARSAAIGDLIEHRKTLQPSAADAIERVRVLRDDWDR